MFAAGEAASLLRRGGRWRGIQQEREGEEKQQTLRACLSTLKSFQGKAVKIDNTAKRGKLAGEK